MTSVTSHPIHRWRAFSLLAVAAFMTVMDLTIVNTALPTIGRELHFSQTSLLWVVTAYGLAYGGFLLLGGRAADLLGRRRIMMAPDTERSATRPVPRSMRSSAACTV